MCISSTHLSKKRAKMCKNVQKRASQIFLDPIQKRAPARSVQLEAVYLEALLQLLHSSLLLYFNCYLSYQFRYRLSCLQRYQNVNEIEFELSRMQMKQTLVSTPTKSFNVEELKVCETTLQHVNNTSFVASFINLWWDL